jgi:hypothetical protein
MTRARETSKCLPPTLNLIVSVASDMMLISKNHELCDMLHGEKIFVIVGEGADYGMKFSVSVHLDRRSPTEKPMTPCKL